MIVAASRRGRVTVFYIRPRLAGDTSDSISADASGRPLAQLVAALQAIAAA